MNAQILNEASPKGSPILNWKNSCPCMTDSCGPPKNLKDRTFRNLYIVFCAIICVCSRVMDIQPQENKNSIVHAGKPTSNRYGKKLVFLL